MTAHSPIERPISVMPEVEAAHVRAAYEAANVILEYGSGGSTVMAAEMPGKQITSVESDANWVQMMQGWFAQNPPAEGTSVEVIHADIGPTGEWGRPQSDQNWRTFAAYPLGVWQLPDFSQPDVVLVDGRFRVGCALAAAYCTKAPLRLLVDDYKRRKQYHVIQDFIGAPSLHGRLAEFTVTPQPIPADRLLMILDQMTRP